MLGCVLRTYTAKGLPQNSWLLGHKEHKEHKEHKGHKEHKEHKGHKGHKGHKEHKGHKGHKWHKEHKKHKEHKRHKGNIRTYNHNSIYNAQLGKYILYIRTCICGHLKLAVI